MPGLELNAKYGCERAATCTRHVHKAVNVTKATSGCIVAEEGHPPWRKVFMQPHRRKNLTLQTLRALQPFCAIKLQDGKSILMMRVGQKVRNALEAVLGRTLEGRRRHGLWTGYSSSRYSSEPYYIDVHGRLDTRTKSSFTGAFKTQNKLPLSNMPCGVDRVEHV